MKSFWSRLYDPAKDRRYGMLFFITVVLFLFLFALAMWAGATLDSWDIGKSDVQTFLLQTLPGILILTVALIWRTTRLIRLNQTRPKEKVQCHKLSRDEILKARVKLVRARKS